MHTRVGRLSEPYDAESFVEAPHLDEVLGWVVDHARDLSRFNESRILWIVGPSNSGKSWLLAHLLMSQRLETEGRVLHLSFGVDSPFSRDEDAPASHISHPLHVPPSEQSSPYEAVRRIQKWASEELGVRDQVTALPVDRALRQLLDALNEVQVVLVVDAPDEADPGFLEIFENYFLSPLWFECRPALFLFAGRQTYRWNDPQLRQIPDDCTRFLKPFVEEDVRKVFQTRSSDRLLQTELGQLLVAGSYPGHVVIATEVGKGNSDLCTALAEVIGRVWQEAGVNFPVRFTLILVRDYANDRKFKRRDVKECFEALGDELPDDLRAVEFINALLEVRIVHWSPEAQLWEVDDGYDRLFQAYLDHHCLDGPD